MVESSPTKARNAGVVVLDRMRLIERAVHRAMQDDLARGGYTGVRIPHITLLAHMTVAGRRLTEFAELMQVTKSAASQLVSDLERQGLVERVPDPTDRRAALIRATPAADAGFRIARRRLAQVERAWARRLGQGRLDQFVALLVEIGQWADDATADRKRIPPSHSGAR
jgi:DNA-binding MarR family transcriptional regulator